ncbi:MAG: iron-containing alcohol dehydrogenase [Sinobacteraceae bacterium]|nr:iron-containing alcohol dehydrogenase [Nevskiaceae bacterium]
MVATRANWSFPTAIRFGVGRIAELPEVCRNLGMRRPLLVTDPALAKLPMVGETLARCAAAGLRVGCFSEIRANPVGTDVQRGLAIYSSGTHDGVIAFGGGSALDVGKVIAFMSGQKRPLWDFEDREDWWTRADAAGIAPVIAVPTTAGTGSEVGRAGVILDEEASIKKIIFHPKMLPSVVIMDPELTVGLPASITAATGMDALSHCIEAYCAPTFHPMAEGVALQGMRLIHDSLSRVVTDGKDVEARGAMLAAAAMGATAFQKGLGGMHALAHPIGAVCNTHHGLTNAVLMPYVLAFNRSAIEKSIGRAAAYLGLGQPNFEGFQEWILGLREKIGIPHGLDQLNVTGAQVEKLAAMAEADPSAAGNPILFDAAAARSVLENALAGRLE